MKIPVLLPHINESGINFEIQGNSIRFGLGNIKFLSDKSAPKVIAGKPYKNYAELLEASTIKGSGISTRIIGALNAVGAAAFPDNPRSGREKDNYYEYLNIPSFDMTKVSPALLNQITFADDFEEKGVWIMMGMVKKIKRGTGWARVEFVDETGSVGVFTNMDTAIETGKMYVFLVGDNRIHRYVEVDDLDREDDTFIDFLQRDNLEVPQGEYYVVDFTPYKTKANKMMAHVIISKDTKEMKRVLVFNKNYPLALSKMRPGRTVGLSLATTEDKTLYVKEFKSA
jgi:DNA polymerase III alpha subunit